MVGPERNIWVLRWTLWFAVMALRCPVVSFSQSTVSNVESVEPKPGVSQSSPDKVPEVVTEPPVGASSEELRQTEIEADTKKLLLLAADLRTEVARTYKDSLSLNVLKKAQEVEKLAKSLKARMIKEGTADRHSNN